MTNNDNTLKTRAIRSRYGLRMRYEEAQILLENMSFDLNDSQVTKAMKLVFGIRKYLAADHCYHEDQWPQLARELKVRSAADLLEIVEKANVFLFVEKKPEGDRAFYYPEYKQFHDHCDHLILKAVREKEKTEDERMADFQASAEHFNEVVNELKETFDCEVCDEACAKSCASSCAESCVNLRKENSANMQKPSEETTPHACAGTGTGNNGDISLPEISPKEQELEAALSASVGRLWTAEGPDGRLHCVRKQLLELLSLPVEENAISKVCFGYLVRRTLVAHFGRQRHREKSPRDFAKIAAKDQDAWLNSLLTSKYFDPLLRQAVDGVRPLIAQAVYDQNHQHPNGEYEWYDPKDRQRYYDDPSEGVTAIPDGVEPRPSATARLHPITKTWKL